jgi:hypothetical protein
MAYIGNNLTIQQYAPQIAYFSGNGSTTAFTLPVSVVSAAQIIVVVANVVQNPSSAYTVSGTTLTFTSAPPSGTNNIWVEYTSLQTNLIQPAAGTVGTTQLSASGTPSSTTYLRGDNTWSTITAGATITPTTSNTTYYLVGTSSTSGTNTTDYISTSSPVYFNASNGTLNSTNMVATGQVSFGGTAQTVRQINFTNNEMAWTPNSGTSAYMNFCDSSGNNGGNYTFYIRGLTSGGSNNGNLTAVNIQSNGLNLNGYNIKPLGYSANTGRSINTWYQASTNCVVTVYLIGSYINSATFYVGTSTSSYTAVLTAGDDINNNTKGGGFTLPMAAGTYYYIGVPSWNSYGFETVYIYEWTA